MKRALAVALCLVALVSAVSVSFAQERVAAHPVTLNLPWRTTGLYATLASLDPAAKKLSGTSGYLDSTYHAACGAGPWADTTVAFPTTSLTTPTSTFFTGADTVSFLRFSLVQTAATATTIDSVYIMPQVSIDGTTWAYVEKIKDIAPGTSGYDLGAGSASLPVSAWVGLYGIGTNAKIATVQFHSCIAGRNSIDACNFWTFPLIRFIVFRDVSSSAITQPATAWVTYWSSSAYTNK